MEEIFVELRVGAESAQIRSHFEKLAGRIVLPVIGILALTMSALFSPLRAQRSTYATSENKPVAEGNHDLPTDTLARFGLWVTATVTAPVSNSGTLPHDRTLVLVGLERQYPVIRGKWGTISTSPSLLPAVFTTDNRRVKRCSVVTEPH